MHLMVILEKLKSMYSGYSFFFSKKFNKKLCDISMQFFIDETNGKSLEDIVNILIQDDCCQLFESWKIQNNCLLLKFSSPKIYSIYIPLTLMPYISNNFITEKQSKLIYLNLIFPENITISEMNCLRLLLNYFHIFKLLKHSNQIKCTLMFNNLFQSVARKYDLNLNFIDDNDFKNESLHFEAVNINICLATNFVFQEVSKQKAINFKCGNVSCLTQIGENDICDVYNLRYNQIKNSFITKYGEIFSEIILSKKIEELTKATIKFDLLSVKASKHIKLDLRESYGVDQHGGIFVLYNCARLATLFSNHQKLIDEGAYPELEDISHINFKNLNKEAEWGLMFNYVYYYPSFLQELSQMETLQSHRVCQFLNNFSLQFSKYYSKTHILSEAKEHLFPIINARIYLMKSIEQIFHRALNLLDINPIKKL